MLIGKVEKRKRMSTIYFYSSNANFLYFIELRKEKFSIIPLVCIFRKVLDKTNKENWNLYRMHRNVY